MVYFVITMIIKILKITKNNNNNYDSYDYSSSTSYPILRILWPILITLVIIILILAIVFWKFWIYDTYFCNNCQKIFRRINLKAVGVGEINKSFGGIHGILGSKLGFGTINQENNKKLLFCEKCLEVLKERGKNLKETSKLNICESKIEKK